MNQPTILQVRAPRRIDGILVGLLALLAIPAQACVVDDDCDDGLVCTWDRCIESTCQFLPHAYGDVNHNQTVNVLDALCIVNRIGGNVSEECSEEDCDLTRAGTECQHCGPDGTLNIFDVLAVLGAIVRDTPCCQGIRCDYDYDDLLAHPRITQAIESHEFTDPGTYMNFLSTKITQLETADTESWSDYRHEPPYTDTELKGAFLQKIALSLYVEVHQLVPWNLLDYSDQDLEILLGDWYFDVSIYYPSATRRHRMWNNNPLVPFAYANELRDLYPQEPFETPKDVLDLTIMRMRADGWVHCLGEFDYAAACGLPEGFYDFECMTEVKCGGSTITPLFIYSVLHAQNVPARQLIYVAHGGMYFPALNLALDGDAVYNTILAGLRLRPNYIPVDNSLRDLDLFYAWSVLPVCEWASVEDRQRGLDYLVLYDDPNWNADVLAAYCYTNYLYPQPGDYLEYILIDATMPFFCQSDDPMGEYYFPPPLTEEEIDAWFAAIAAVAGCP